MRIVRWVVQLFRLGQVRSDRPDRSDEPVRPDGPLGPDALTRLAYYNTYEARMFFSQIIKRVSYGEEIVIGRSGVPTVKLVPYRGERIRQGLLRLHLHVVADRDRRGRG